MASKDTIVNIADAAYPTPVHEKGNPMITISELNPPIRPVNKRQNTDSDADTASDEQLTNFGRRFFTLLENPIIRYAIFIVPVGALLAIPLALFATKYKDTRADGIRLLGLFIWIQILWVSLWIAKLVAAAVPYIFQGLCGLISTGVRKYALVLRALEIPISLFIWTIVALVSVPVICVFDKEYFRKSGVPWIHILQKVCRASIGSSALWLALKLLMQLISVSYHGKQYKDKIKDVKQTSHAIGRLYQASLERFPDHHPDLLAEDYDIHDSTNVQKLLKQYSADRATLRIFGDIHYFGERLVSAFGRMASDISGVQVFTPTAAHAVVESALERRAGAEALARRIYVSLVQPGAQALCESDISAALAPTTDAETHFIFHQLDRDGNGDIELSEMMLLFTSISRTRKDIWRSVVDIKHAIKTLDSVLSVIVLLVITIIYSAFFSSFIATNWKGILGILSAGAFSFGQTVGEFNAACILVFVKHPFDVGDRVNIAERQYLVKRISLLYTVFLDIDTNTIVQVANCTLGNLWVDNVSRSRAQKERLTFSVYPTTSFHDIELLRHELTRFVTDPENSRDFQPEVNIELLSVGNLKQLDLRVEIKHKSNWANEKLRAYRRSKFMCALLSAMRKVPIDGPSGAGPAQGSLQAPNYSVTITDAQAHEAKVLHTHDKEAAKMAVPVARDGQEPVGHVAVSSGLEVLPRRRPGELDEVLGGAWRRPSVAGASRR